MATSPESARAPAAPQTATIRWSRKRSPTSPAPRDRRWLLAAAGLVLLHLGHPLTWHWPMPPLWMPAAGIGLALVAWLGARAALLVLADGLVVALQVGLVHRLHGQDAAGPALAAAADAVLLAIEVCLAWWIYRLSGASRGLGDPTSAVNFLLLVPGLAAGLMAPLHAVLLGLAGTEEFGVFAYRAAAFWMADALGLLALGPPLLVALTPWLIRQGLVPPERPGEYRVRQIPAPPTRGDWVEVSGLAFATAILAALLALSRGRSEVMGWLLGGLSLLLVLWASLTQKLRGGTLVAATAVILSLALVAAARGGVTPIVPLQGHLLALCSSALLVGASAGWLATREARYRQVVTRIPLVLYSARVLQPGVPGAPPEAAELIFVSPACRHVLGCKPEDLLGDFSRWLGRVHPTDRELVVAALAQLRRQNQAVTCEYRLAPAEPPPGQDDVRDRAAPVLIQRPWHGRQPAGALAPPTAGADRWVRETLTPRYDARGQLIGWEGVVLDITEPRHLAGSLRRTTSMFHALVAHLPAGVFFVQGPAGWPIMVNARARELLGHHESAAVDLTHLVQFYGLHRPDGSPYPTEELPVSRALRLGMSSMRDDIVIHRPDGRKIPLVTWAAPIDLTGHGRPDAAVWVFEDLTALRQAEAAHRESETRLGAVIETMAEGLVVYDRTGKVVDCNPAACEILGLPAERLRGQSPLDPDGVTLREDGTPLPGAEHPVLIALTTGRPVRGAVVGLAGHGEAGGVRWLLVNAMPLRRRPDQPPAQVVSTFADITAARQALEVVRASEEKYRGLIETLPIMVVLCGLDRRVSYVNPALEAVTGYSLADVREPAAWQAIVHRDNLPALQARVEEVLAGQARQMEFRFRAKDGSARVGHAIMQPRFQGPNVVGVTTLIVDMTVQRRLEEELQRAQRLELVGRLASGIAHDFNNMLTVVLTLTELAHDTLPPEHPVRDDLRRVGEAAEQAANLAGQVLAFSRQRQRDTGRVEVNAVVKRTLELLRGTLPANITVEAELTPGSLRAQADETQLQQVLMNLCLNARDAMPRGGRLVVRTAAVAPPDEPAAGGADWVCLSVLDSGHGIDADTQARIFTPFFSTKEGGTGLGLAVVQQIVESYGGRIEVRSQPGEGTRFDVWLLRK